MQTTTATTELATVQDGEKQMFEVRVVEQTFYTLKVQATSLAEAKRMVKKINTGESMLADFDGGDQVTRFGLVRILA
jgi:hypothetical protein